MIKLISICIPTYEYKGFGTKYLKHIFDQLVEQTFKDFDIVVADHSVDNSIRSLCADYREILDIKYFRNTENRGSGSANTDFVLRKATGKYLKILCGDDYFFNETSLEITMNALDNNVYWLATAYVHSDDRINYHKYHLPKWNENIHLCNTLGTPSCITVRNTFALPEIDKNLTYYYDCDFYGKLALLHGQPKIIDSPTIVNYLHSGSITSITTQQIIDREFEYIRNKYA
jgi:glycosyltransferase involved in cell wall biosynthesis